MLNGSVLHSVLLSFSDIRFSDGRIYEGEWVSGRREGYGEIRGRPEDGKHPDEWTFYAGNVMYWIGYLSALYLSDLKIYIDICKKS